MARARRATASKPGTGRMVAPFPGTAARLRGMAAGSAASPAKRLRSDEHAGQNGLAIAFGGQGHDRPVANLELDPGTALALQVDELDQRRCSAWRGSEPDSARHYVALDQAAAHHLVPRSATIL